MDESTFVDDMQEVCGERLDEIRSSLDEIDRLTDELVQRRRELEGRLHEAEFAMKYLVDNSNQHI